MLQISKMAMDYRRGDAGRKVLLALPVLLLALSGRVPAETLTLPAAASVVGLAPFFSDVRTFNTSYTQSLVVTAQYRCFIGICPGGPQTFTLGPRESRAFDDVCVSLFSAPGSAGTVEFSSPGTTLVVTSRLYSTAPIPTVGMFVPGLRLSEAHAVSVLTSLANGAFRTNVGVYNPNDVGVGVTVQLFNGAALLGTVPIVLAPRSGTQINQIFGVVGQGGVTTTNAHAVVQSDNARPLFTYAAVIDNATTDPLLVTGAEDVPVPPGFTPPTPTATPAPPAATPTPTPPTTTVVQLVARQFAWSFEGGGNSFTMKVGQSYEIRMTSNDVTHGFPGIPALGLSGATLSRGNTVVRTITPSADQVSLSGHVFFCNVPSCGSGHSDMEARIRVEP